MKKINTYIIEKLKKISSKNVGKQYNYFPEDDEKLYKLLKHLIIERGNEADLNDIDTSKITNMDSLFAGTSIVSNFDGDISEWDISNVTNMKFMFCNSKFSGKNGDIGKWKVNDNVEMNKMFYNCPLEKNPPKWYHE